MKEDLKPLKFKSVHDFMDAIFCKENPTSEEIISAKKQYWKSYNLDLIQRRRKMKTEFTIGLTKEELKDANLKMTKEKSMTEYIRNVFLYHLNSSSSYKPVDTSIIEQQLLMIVDYLKELIDNETILNDTISSQLRTYIKNLESLMKIHFDN